MTTTTAPPATRRPLRVPPPHRLNELVDQLTPQQRAAAWRWAEHEHQTHRDHTAARLAAIHASVLKGQNLDAVAQRLHQLANHLTPNRRHP